MDSGWQDETLGEIFGNNPTASSGFAPGAFRVRRLYNPNNSTATTSKSRDRNGCAGKVGDPVEIDDGAKLLEIPLFKLPGEMGLQFALYYHSVTSSSFWASNPWATSISYVLDMYCGYTNPNISCSQVTLYRPDGSSISFSGNHAAYGNFPEIGGGGLATLVHNSDGTWTLHDEDSDVESFDTNGYLTSIKDASGVGWTLSTSSYSTSAAGVVLAHPPVQPCAAPAGGVHTLCTQPNPPPPPPSTHTTTTVTHTDGQSFTITEVVTNAGSPSMTESVTVTDPAGSVYTYWMAFYPTPTPGVLSDADVASLTFPGAPATTMTFSYVGSQGLLSQVAYNGTPYWSTSYDSSNRVDNDGAADGTEQTSIAYAATSGGGLKATITNPLGMTTTNTYVPDAQGNLLLTGVSDSAVLGCGSTTSSMAWDANDNPTRTVDNDGVAQTYSYAANGQLQTETEAAGTGVARTINYVWDPDAQLNRPLSMTIPGKAQVSYVYNSQNRLASVTRTNLSGVGTANQALTTSYVYGLYANGMVQTLTVTQPSPGGSDWTSYQYDAHGNVTSATDALGHATTWSNYNALGEAGKVVGPNGDETDYTYDARGRVVTKTTHPNGGTATWSYAYDGFGLLAQVNAPDGEVTTWTRDAEMRVKTITHNDKDGASTESFAYDAAGNVISDVVARGGDIGKSTSYVYNALGKVYQVKGAHGQMLTYTYDGNGNVLSVTDALGHVTHYAYDPLGRRTSVTNAAGGVTSYAYDAGDHITRVTDPRGLVTGYAWDGFGHLWQRQSPDSGTTGYVYDGSGRLQSFTRADGTPTYFAYDALNRVTSEGAGTETRKYTWDTCAGGIGRLCAANTQGYSNVSYAYSPEGWVLARAFLVAGSPSYSLGYTYDDMGHLASVRYPDGNQAQYSYVDGAVAKIMLQVGSYLVTGVSNITYRPMDLAMSGWTSYNGLANSIAYDSDLRPTSITVPGVEGLALAYDAANRITGIANGVTGNESQALGYDALGELTSVASGVDTESYAYDADGNRVSQVVNGLATSFTYAPGSNRLAGTSGAMAASYGYDANGNTTTVDGLGVYTYGPFNRLMSSGGAAFTVSAEGQRIAKVSAAGATYFALDAGGALQAEDLAGDWYDYVWLNGKLVTVISNGGVFPVHADQTGRPLSLTDPNSHAIDWQAEGLPFGSNVTLNRWGAFNVGFPGQYWDAEDSLWHNGARDCDPWLGRYIESDPIGLAGGVNTYAYVGDNPISGVDPLGLCDKKCSGLGRGIGNDGHLAGLQGGIPGTTVQLGTAAVDPAQFGVANGAALAPYASGIYGTIGGASFSGVTDVIGGKSPIPGMNVRAALETLNPGQLIIEVNGGADQGTNVPVTIYVPQGLNCPSGTSG